MRSRRECRYAPILLDAPTFAILEAERRDRSEGRSAPLRWLGFIDELSRALSGMPACRWSPQDLVVARGQLVACLPSAAALATAMRGGPLTYLCWGLPNYGDAKNLIFTMLLSRATHLVVNEEVTRGEILARIGRAAALAPYFVDADYFSYRSIGERDDFLFCNGSNGRDPNVLIGLVEIGHKLVWLCNDAKLRDAYGSRHPRLKVCSSVSFDELRRLYQTCAAAIIPVKDDHHAAGQTTGIEAIACGAPLYISQCRAASIFAGLPTVTTLSTNDVAAWSHAITESLRASHIAAQSLTQLSSSIIRQRMSISVVTDAWSRHLCSGGSPTTPKSAMPLIQ
jgi:hypothetical protein